MTQSLAIRALSIAALLCFSGGAFADRASDANARYQQDRAACMRGDTHQDRATCLREAGAALQESRRGGLSESSRYEENKLARCERQPAADRPDCIRRMSGEGVVSGSVAGGGIYRELTTIVPAPQ